MVSYAAKRGTRALSSGHQTRGRGVGKMMYRGAVSTNGQTLMAQYALRRMLKARARNGKRAQERVDDQQKIKPDTSPDAVDGAQEPRISGARLEEMLKLAGGEETAS